MKVKTTALAGVSAFLLLAFLSISMVRIVSYINEKRSVPVFQVLEEIEIKASATAKPVTSSKVVSKLAPRIISTPMPITPPRILYQILPAYPKDALKQGLEGTVLLSLFVSRNGSVQDVKVEQTSGYEEFDKSAIAAAYSWKFSPAMQGLVAVDSYFKVPVKFIIK